jgi:exodeoxyribonuclease V alpha subunit
MLEALVERGIIGPLDAHFAQFLTRHEGQPEPSLAIGAALVSRWTRDGHICLYLNELAGRPLDPEGSRENFFCPDLQAWTEALRRCSCVGGPGDPVPLILDDRGRLYLQRFWQYEESLVRAIELRMNAPPPPVDEAKLRAGLNRLFEDESKDTPGRRIQKLAVFTAVMNRFCIISGGPGTGKTWTVALVLRLLAEQKGAGKILVALTAPTGKAASRLFEATESSRYLLPAEVPGVASLELEPMTIHRLLGSLSRKTRPNDDIVVIDEASMADLAMMSRLLDLLPLSTRLLWLGDKDQLSSVEAGTVLGDVCGDSDEIGYSAAFSRKARSLAGVEPEEERQEPVPVRDRIVLLTESHRFGGESEIGALSRAVNLGDASEALRILKKDGGEVAHVDTDQTGGWRGLLKDRLINAFLPFLEAGSPAEAFVAFSSFRVICALRRGPLGVEAVNLWIESLLKKEKLINTYPQWYIKRPILITKNDYALDLFNGDTGLVLRDPDRNTEPSVFFPQGDGTFRTVAPHRLSDCETVYAMTVHKSQGSEFDEVLLLLPDSPSPVLTRELLYTAVTRARKRVEVWGKEEVIRQAVSRRIERRSGLKEALWSKTPG